jgi:hypothetical protein
MRRSFLVVGAALIAASLPACVPQTEQPADTGAIESSSSSAALRYATVEGVVQKSGVGIYMQGSHRLQMDDGTFLLLESSTLRLDEYLDERVIVSGSIQPTVEDGGMIMDVDMIEEASAMLEPEVLTEESSSSSEMSSSAAMTSSAARSSSSVVISMSSPTPVQVSSVAASSSAKPVVVASSSSSIVQAVTSSPAASQPESDRSATITTMAKASVDATTFTTKYCSGHIGFCLPMHRNWYFQSFGANVSPYLWHVEVSNQEVSDAGQGIIMINLVSGALAGSEGVAVAQGDFVVASKQWTANRHFEISGPPQLKAAIEFMANGVEVYATE